MKLKAGGAGNFAELGIPRCWLSLPELLTIYQRKFQFNAMRGEEGNLRARRLVRTRLWSGGAFQKITQWAEIEVQISESQAELLRHFADFSFQLHQGRSHALDLFVRE